MTFKENDIRDLRVLRTYLDLVSIESKNILANKESFETIDQKTWGLGNSVIEFNKSGYNYERCIDSGSIYVNPRPKLEILNDFYASADSGQYWVREFFMPKVELRRKKIFKPRAEFVKNKFSKSISKMRVGDIGAGVGIFIEELKKLSLSGLDIEAIEPSNYMAKICREKNIFVRQSMLENLVDKIVPYDLLTSFELFEHLQNPLKFLKDCSNLLNPGGYLYMTTLNSHGFDIQVLWEKSNSIFPPHHLNFFNPISMKNILKIIGFKNIEIDTPGELDVDIIRNAHKNEQNEIPRFLKTMFDFYGEDEINNFQKFIKDNCFSSHMRVFAQKG